MKMIRVVITLVLIIAICFLSLYQMQIRGYEKVARLNEWTLYINDDGDGICALIIEVFYIDSENKYAFPCAQSDDYIVKSGFEEHSITYALENGLIDIEDLVGVLHFFTYPIEE